MVLTCQFQSENGGDTDQWVELLNAKGGCGDSPIVLSWGRSHKQFLHQFPHGEVQRVAATPGSLAVSMFPWPMLILTPLLGRKCGQIICFAPHFPSSGNKAVDSLWHHYHLKQLAGISCETPRGRVWQAGTCCQLIIQLQKQRREKQKDTLPQATVAVQNVHIDTVLGNRKYS